MRIGELAQSAGVPVETVRFYEAKELLPAPVRLANNYRSYGPRHLARLHFIRHCRNLDIPLADIAQLVSFDPTSGADAERIHSLIEHQIENIGKRISELETLRGNLRELLACCHGHGTGEKCGVICGLEQCEPSHCTHCGHPGNCAKERHSR
jgi:DNA-binding transcriptional MerR regulator